MPSKSNHPAKKSKKTKASKTLTAKIPLVKFIEGSTDVLVIAPHGVNKKGVKRNDSRTDIVAAEIAKQLNCSALINDSVRRADLNYNDCDQAETDEKFIKNMRSVLDSEGHTLVLWIHGFKEEKRLALEEQHGIDGNASLDCLIGYGQGVPKRFTAKKATIDSLIATFVEQDISAYKAIPEPPGREYCAHDLANMNQWCRERGYKNKNKVESLQLEFKEPGFRKTDLQARKLGAKIANAVRVMVRPTAEVIEPTVVHNAIENEDTIVEEAYKFIKDIFRRHFHNAMLEAGHYIINTFYEKNPRSALAKNKSKDQPPNLKKLIEKLRGASGSADEDVPSMSWFYNAVNLAAHESIATELGLQTFGKLGHSHKLQLLHVPPRKSVKADDFETEIKPAFEEKERLAKYAIETKGGISVRDFKEYIDQQYPKDELNLIDLPPTSKLRKRDRGELVKLWNQGKNKIEDSQKLIGSLTDSLQRLEIVLAEVGASPNKGKGRFQDWTRRENNVNICTGCENNCLYCYSNLMATKWKQVQTGHWHEMQIRQNDVDKARKLHDGLVGFPTSHDITPANIDAYLIVLGKLLRAGNEVLIITKPQFECIKQICDASPFFKDKILFRFTIGAMDEKILSFWEPNAPAYEERLNSLRYAYENGFRTSVSMEPMLDTVGIEQLIAEVRQFVNEDIWIGTMNHLEQLKSGASKRLQKEIAIIEAGQSEDVLVELYDTYKDDPLIKWKTDAFKIIEKAINRKFEKWDKENIKDDEGVEREAIAPVIISATRNSDLPAWHSDWLMERLRRGHLLSSRYKWQYVSFSKTRLIVFWTKNPRPMFKYLDELDQMGIGYYFTYSLNDFEKEGLEPHLPALQGRIDTFRELSDRIGKEKVVWRFDPLVLAKSISRELLVEKIGSLMDNLAGHTEKMVFSFLDPKRHRAQKKLKNVGIDAIPFSDDDKIYVAQHIAEMASKHNILAATCSEALKLSKYGIQKNKCVDDELMRKAFVNDADLIKFLGLKKLEHFVQGDHCGCVRSFDIGSRNTCRNGCVYCYANDSQDAVKRNIERLSKTGEMLIKPKDA